MLRILTLLAVTVLFAIAGVSAAPMTLLVPTDNISVSLDGKILIDRTQGVEFEFTDTGEKMTFLPDSYVKLRNVMDRLFELPELPSQNYPVFIAIPQDAVASINELLKNSE